MNMLHLNRSWCLKYRKCLFSYQNVGVFVLLLMASTPAWADNQSGNRFKSFSLSWENDVFANTDRDYTNGLKLTWSRPLTPDEPIRGRLSGWVAAIMNHLPVAKDWGVKKDISISVGQNIYTPEDTKRKELIVDDRPYAGFLYAGLGLHAISDRRKEVWEIDVGVVGPLAMGEQVQDFSHKLTGSSAVQGWDNQLNNEPALEIIYETKWRLWQWRTDDHLGFDFIPHLGACLGNVAIYANAGAEFRFGWYIPQDFGSCPIRAGCSLDSVTQHPGGDSAADRLGFHIFMAVDGRAVLHDIFLDGNTFSDSHSVDRENFVSDWMAGFALNYSRYRFSYAYILRTKEFKQQHDPQIFGTLTFSFTY